MSRTVAIGADHAGVGLKAILAADLSAAGYTVLDCGTHGPDSVDYPDFGYAVGQAVAEGRAWRGVAICGSGIGISIAVNRVPGARAALCAHGLMARLARQHNDANVLAVGGRMHALDEAAAFVDAYLAEPFSGDARHARRIAQLADYEKTGVLPPLPPGVTG